MYNFIVREYMSLCNLEHATTSSVDHIALKLNNIHFLILIHLKKWTFECINYVKQLNIIINPIEFTQITARVDIQNIILK